MPRTHCKKERILTLLVLSVSLKSSHVNLLVVVWLLLLLFMIIVLLVLMMLK